MVTLLTATLIALAPQDDSGLPTPPPPLPTYVVDGDGTRHNCTATESVCWLPDVFE